MEILKGKLPQKIWLASESATQNGCQNRGDSSIVRSARSDKKDKTQVAESYPGLRPVDIDLNLNTINLLTLKKKKKTYGTLRLHRYLKEAIIQYFLEFHIDTKSGDLLFQIGRQSVDEYLDKITRLRDLLALK